MQSVLVVTLLSVWMVPALGDFKGSGGTITKTYSAYCPSHSLPHGSIEIVSGGVNSYSCQYGYRLEGHSKNYCQVDGSWTYSIPECTEMMCPAVTAPARASILGIRGGSAQRQYWPHESAVQYSCADGYELVGSPQLSCMAGEWQGEEPQCEETTCKVPLNVLTTLEYSRSESASVYEMALFSCPEGEVLSGDDMAFCGQDGRWDWSERPRCIKDCEWTEWSDWNGCTVTCGTGQQKRKRSKKHYGVDNCNGPLEETQTCNENQCPKCKKPSDHQDVYIVPRGGSCYWFVNREEYHSKAKENCKKSGGHLVTIDDQETNDWLLETATKEGWTNNGMWIGAEWKDTEYEWTVWGRTKVKDGHWTWQNGDPVNFNAEWQWCHTLFCGCATMRLNDGGKWRPTTCSWWYKYVCEIPAE